MKTFEQHVNEKYKALTAADARKAVAKDMGVTVQVVYKWIRMGAVVIDGRIYRPSKYKV